MPSSPRRALSILRRTSLPLAVALAACNGGGGGNGAPAPANPAGGNPAGGNPAGNNQGGGVPPAPAFTRLWVPNFNAAELRGWNRTSLLADRDNAPDVVLTLPAGTRPNAVTFDAAGNLWVTDNANARLLEFARSQLGTSGSPTPAVVIDTDGTSLREPIGLQFDGGGNLWVATADRLEMFVPSNLDDSGPTTPNRVLSASGFDYPAGVVFDGAGNLWMTNASFTPANNYVAAFTPSQLAAGGAQVPQLKVTSGAFALIEGLRFDAAGNLWIASNDGLSVTRFTAAAIALPVVAETRNLAAAASLEADIDDTASGRTVRKPGGLVFDRDGNLYVNSERGAIGGTTSAVLRFTATQLDYLGAANVPAAILVSRSTSNPGFGGLALEP